MPTQEAEFAGRPMVLAGSVADWRSWLDHNAGSSGPVWLVVHHRRSATPGLRVEEVVEHALCYGWIDSKAVKRDDESFYLTMSPRNPMSTWSKVNRERVGRMIDQGLMRPPGQAAIDLAKRTGAWDALAEAQDGVVPDDLQALLDHDEVAFRHFQAFAPSSRRMILEWIATAKRPETRRRRVLTTVELARRNVAANQPVRRSGPGGPPAP